MHGARKRATAYIGIGAVVHAGTDETDELMATLVNDQRAN